ncbi:MAG: TlyA family RNA methyltransferase [Betaproteobacteria bacterium]|nr:MAG: TlyA family RNA methyltransferase [Betaproteobacteria bacterium]TMH27337.1 MAG: TlyA family RNA methyltransferase [Betaproteobacteria bacterium]
MRADQLLVSRGIAPTRSAAQRLIASGAVRWRASAGWAVPRKAGEDLPDDCDVEVTDDAELRFVSRGGLKLAGALAHVGLDVRALRCLDVGQGSGGFSDALLHGGAAQVVGIDVGHGQLNPRIAEDARVVSHEGINARDVAGTVFESETPLHSFDLVTGDLSFISLTLVLPTLARYLTDAGHLLMLVKPQFELQPQDIGKGGVVKDAASYVVVEQRIRDACVSLGLGVRDYFPSSIDGGDGNREFFVWAQPTAERKAS